jgi:ATP-binding cassette subfamily B protein
MSGLMMPLMMFVGNFGFVVVCIVGAVLAVNNMISFGVIVAFMLYIRLFTQPLTQLAQAATNLQSTAAASERVFEFLAEKELANENDKKEKLEAAIGDVEFKNVRFGYSQDKMVINNFSVTAKAGEKVAIVGPTGAGKTTLVNLLMRFYEVNGGEILIDGVPINNLTRDNIHDLFSMVLQDTWLFEGSIRENIIYSRNGVSDEEVVAACKSVGLHHFIKTLPMGYDTILDDKANLSAGQKQLITIARAMVDNKPLLILDEATSSVDTRTEVLIQQAMDKLTVGKTSFVIAHRLSTIKNADLILVMKDGDIIESGNHEELLSKNGFYEELYNSQFEEAS